jgi:hypothetical protein
MTMLAARTPEGKIAVRITQGMLDIKLTEDLGHLRAFHGELGRLLDKMEREQHAPGTAPAGYDYPAAGLSDAPRGYPADGLIEG